MSIAYNKLYPKLLSSVSADDLDQIFTRIKQPTWYYNNAYTKIPLPHEDIEPGDDNYDSKRDFNRYYMEYVEERLKATNKHYEGVIHELIKKTRKKIVAEDVFYKRFNVDNIPDEWKPIDKMRQLKFGHKTLLEWYDYFRSQLRKGKIRRGKGKEYAPAEAQEQEQEVFGYRSRNKIKALGGDDYKIPDPDDTPEKQNWFPIKRNINYQLRHVDRPNTYLIDLMFAGKDYAYLICVNANTRFLMVETTNLVADEDGKLLMMNAKKDSASFLTAFERILGRTKISFLRSDDEASFTSAEALEYYQRHNITYNNVERLVIGDRNMINHTSLAIIDRIIRTIRDIAHNWGTADINPPVMNHIIEIYNKAPHDTLSKIMGFPVSPTEAQKSPELESEIIRRIIAQNHDIRERHNYNIDVGDDVMIYNESDSKIKRRSVVHPSIYVVVGYNGAFYFLKTKDDYTAEKPDAQILKVPRSKLKFLDWTGY
jgi:hypothetical protein